MCTDTGPCWLGGQGSPLEEARSQPAPGELMLESYNKDPGSLDGFWYSLPLSRGNREGCMPKKTQILLPVPSPHMTVPPS